MRALAPRATGTAMRHCVPRAFHAYSSRSPRVSTGMMHRVAHHEQSNESPKQFDETLKWLLIGGGSTILAYLAYNKATHLYATMILGSAATEQLYMQGLEGTVELELRIEPFSTVGELRGLLTPVSERPHTSGPVNHRAFTLLTPAEISSKTRRRHEAAVQMQLPPVAMTRLVSIYAPAPLSALVTSQAQETFLYCRKSRAETQYFSEAPMDWRGWTLSEM